MTRPNIVFIMSDDHAAHAISAYGSRVNCTPHLDRIAEEGVRMDAVFCTNSICSPSRASILTGTYSHVNGVSSIWTEMDYRVPTFVEALHEDGYATAMFGKWHLGEHGQSLPRGFDAWQIFPGQGDYQDPEMIDADGPRTVPGYATDIVTDLAIEWIDGRDADEPFCMMVHHKAPHRPWVPDEKHTHLYADGSIPEPETFFDDLESRSQAVRGVHMTIADDMGADDLKTEVPPHLRGEENREARMRWKYQIYMRDYLQCIQSIDDNVGRLLDHLDDQGLRDSTLVVYTSDQGFFLGDHGWFDKRLMYDQSLQMPMLIRWPAEIAPGSRCEAIITNVDFAATFLDICGLDPSRALPTSQGRSFRPLLRGEEVEDWPDAAYYRYWEHDDPIHHAPAHYGIRTQDHKLIHYYGAGLGVPGASDRIFEAEWELYDLAADPTEVRNVADDPAYAGVRAALEVKLAAYQAHYADESYRGEDTPHPEWGPYDEEVFARVAKYVEEIDATSR
ncbi:sulfatase [Brachybacterium sp. SGAir0954]|uniref:sulfatase family protein n=1 Tax=Brachybacterium sp. SGAir0954 TaxID=2571029 RepID=UPI0010CCF53D|nr:sulfatase [Brachybacterium sp. SGAir0954]QCR52998.1 sulfatase [Brachybacterium sp. SGAir0954]